MAWCLASLASMRALFSLFNPWILLLIRISPNLSKVASLLSLRSVMASRFLLIRVVICRLVMSDSFWGVCLSSTSTMQTTLAFVNNYLISAWKQRTINHGEKEEKERTSRHDPKEITPPIYKEGVQASHTPHVTSDPHLYYQLPPPLTSQRICVTPIPQHTKGILRLELLEKDHIPTPRSTTMIRSSSIKKIIHSDPIFRTHLEQKIPTSPHKNHPNKKRSPHLNPHLDPLSIHLPTLLKTSPPLP